MEHTVDIVRLRRSNCRFTSLRAMDSQLTSGENHVGRSSVSPEAPLAFREQTLLYVTIQTIEKDTGEHLPGDVEQGDSPVVVAELPVHLLLVEMDDCDVFEILENLFLAPHRLEVCCKLFHQFQLLVDLPQPLLYKMATSVEDCLVCSSRAVDVGFVLSVLLDEQSVDVCVVVMEPVLHVLLISPPDENIVQQLSAPRPRVHPHDLLTRRKAEEGVGQQEPVFCTGSQKKEAVNITATETVGTQNSLPGSMVRPEVGVEVNKDN
ncbi:unnamed protein product [Schistocephalus solidus]|uniref:Uncharacterized protein n=1 Tax=Schistocephalus solidus TaxID=70667 RepID=A0A183T965_SCHSO|nr:unnamed protein product [Schistocephalus solidus]